MVVALPQSRELSAGLKFLFTGAASDLLWWLHVTKEPCIFMHVCVRGHIYGLERKGVEEQRNRRRRRARLRRVRRWGEGHKFIRSLSWERCGCKGRKTFRNLLTRLICSWWEGFHDRVPTNKHNSGMPDLLWCGSTEWTPPFPGFHGGDPVSGGPSRSHSASGDRKVISFSDKPEYWSAIRFTRTAGN